MMNRITTLKTFILIAVFIFNSLQALHAEESTRPCKTLIASIADEKPEQFDFRHRSFTSTFVTGGLMFGAAQGIRTLAGLDTFFSKAFWLTAPTDLLLTLTTHAITLSNFKPLKHFLDGKFLGPKLEPHMKIFANAMLGVAYIHASWVAGGITITPAKAGMSIALCAVVYPTLYLIKTRLFKKLPLHRDRVRMQVYRNDPVFGKAFTSLAEEVSKTAMGMKIPESEIELLSLTFIENLIADWPIETKIQPNSFTDTKSIESLADKIKSETHHWRIRHARQRLIRHLVSLAKNPSVDPEERARLLSILDLGAPFSPESSLAFHEAILQRSRVQRLRIWGSSLLDQSLSVGVAGGVGMYYVNDYAIHH